MTRAARKFQGVGGRIEERLRALGFINNGAVAIMDFWRSLPPDTRRQPSYLYDWLNDKKVPGYENALWLAEHLKCDAGWLLFGPPTAARRKLRAPRGR